MVISSNIIKSQKIRRILVFYLFYIWNPSNACVNGTLMTRLPAGRQGLPRIRKHPLPGKQGWEVEPPSGLEPLGGWDCRRMPT